jgi:D-serine deaminase-like pyridoxal phosphate-dependent protein
MPATENDLDTPALVVDVERLERNLARWQQYANEAGLVSRPHIKTHKCIEVARRQLDLGAVGIACQKLGEAEVMADAGIVDILIPYNLLGPRKLSRLAALLGRADLMVSVDDERLLGGLASAAAQAGRELGVLVECDTGYERAGVGDPDAAAELGRTIAGTDGLAFSGFLTYPSPPSSLPFLERAAERARALRIPVRTISGGGTPRMWTSRELRPTVTEYRVGTYAYFDRSSVAAGAASLEDVALTVLTTVVSRPTADRAILDSGSKALTSDPAPDPGFGLIVEAPRSSLARLSEEHGHVALDPGDRLELGQRVHVVPNHVCPVSNLFEELWAMRGSRIVGRWAIAARGRVS